MNSITLDSMTRALENLAVDDRWRAMLAENIIFASYEGFMQSSILAALNHLPGNSLLTDREKQVESPSHVRKQPDLLLFERGEDNQGFWRWWLSDTGTPRERWRLAVAFVGVKVLWTEGYAKSSARLTSKLESVLEDFAKLRAIRDPGGKKDLVEIVLLAGAHWREAHKHEPAVGADRIRQCQVAVLDELQPQGCVLLRDHWLVRDTEVIPTLGVPGFCVYTKALILEVQP